MATATTWETVFAADNSSSVSWQDVLKTCLYEPRAQAGASQTHPLAIMLFLLDGLSVLRCLRRDGQDNEHPLAGRDGANDEEKAMTRSDVAEHFQIYLSELYLQAQEPDSSTAPFHLTREDLLSTALLKQAMLQAGVEGLSATSTDTFLDALRSVCTECLDKLQQYRSSSAHQNLLELPSANGAIRSSQDTSRTDNTSQISFSAVEATSKMLDTILSGPSTLPVPDVSLQATLVQALAPSNGKEGRQRKGASTSARRWILASLLKHYLGDSACFGQQTINGSVRYASSTADDAAIRAYFSRSGSASTPSSPPAISVSNPVNESLPKRSDSLRSTNTHISLDPAAEAEAQQARRDDKLRWLFGENVSTKSLTIAKSYTGTTPTILSPSSPFAPPSPGKYSRLNHHRPEALRFPSTGMQGGDRAPLSPPHRRAWSAGSEGTFRTAGASPSEPSFSPALGGGFPRSPVAAAGPTQDILFTQQGGSRTPLTGSSSSDDMASITTRNPNDSSAGLGNSLTRFSSIDTTDSSTALLGAHRRIPSSGSGGTPLEIPYRGPFQSGLIRLDEGPEGSPPNAGLSTWGTSGKGLNRSNSTSSVRSEPAFERRDQLPLPPTVNVMTPREKQSMVRKSRKLKAVLGEGVDDAQFMQLQQARATSPDATKALKQRFVDDDDHAGADSSDMSRATSADLLSSMSRAGDLTDTFTSPDMALQSKSTLSKPITGDEEATTPTAASHRSKDNAEPPMSPSFSTSTSENDTGSPAAHQTHFPTSPRKAGHKVRRTNSGRYDPEQQAKEARRRKLMKVQAFLGERVPLDALSEQAGPLKSPGSGKLKKDSSKRSTKLLSRASSTLISNKLGKSRPGLPAMNSKGSLSADDKERSPSPSLRGSRKDSRSRLSRAAFGSEGDEPFCSETGEWTYVQVDPTASPISKQQTSAANGSAATEDGVDPAITAIRRARKLEKVFGSLPPAQMYSSRRPAYQAPSAKKLVARDDRPAFLPSRSASFSANSLKSKSSNSSLYRQSLASLRYIANSGDPELIDGLARLVLAEEDEGTDSEIEGNRTVKKNAKDAKDVPMTDEDERKSILGDVSGTEDDEQLAGKTASEAGGPRARSSIDTNASISGTFGHGPTRDSIQSHARTGSALSSFSAFGTSPSGSNPRNTFTGSVYGPPSSSAAGALYRAGRLGRESAMSGMTTHSSADSAYAFDGGLGGAGGHEGSPRSSMESVRIQFRRAHKLAKVFGTTRGEVFNKVLDDIEADMNEDEELDEDERRDVLENVAALRASL